jgi:membrane protease subunit HflK
MGGEEITPEQLQRLVASILRFIVAVPLILIVLYGVFSSYYIIQAEERGVIRRFGRFAGIADPGLHFKLPFGIDTVTKVATERVLKQEFGFRTQSIGDRTQYESGNFSDESLMLTGDLNVIDVSWIVQYRIADPKAYLFNIQDPERTLRDVTESVMRRIVGNRIGSDVLTTARVEISRLAREEIQSIMESYNSGIAIGTVELQDVVPPVRVQPAFNEVNVARQAREQLINEAEKRRNQRIPRTEGQALQVMAEAEGYAAERVNRAKGEASRFVSILEEYEQAREVTRKRLYLEMIDQVLPRAGRVIVLEQGANAPLPLLDLNAPSTVRLPGREVSP